MSINFNKAVEMVQFKEKVLSGGVVVRCDTEEKARIFLEWAHFKGKTWYNGVSYKHGLCYGTYENKTCYCLSVGRFSSYEHGFTGSGHEHMSYEDALLLETASGTRDVKRVVSPVLLDVPCYPTFSIGGFMKDTMHKKAIFNDAATVVIWNDDTKTIVKCTEGDYDKFDQEKGYLMAYFQKHTGMSKTQCAKFMKAL
jgi:hypothetical protein